MVFSDLFFLFVFLPAFLLCYLLATWIDGQRSISNGLTARNAVLVVFSLIFYAWGEPVYVFLMLFCVLMNYIAGLCIDRTEQYRKAALTLGLACNIGILSTFKYLGFLAQCLTDLGISVAVPTIALPIGISFYTFQSMSYLVDVYRHESPVQRRFGGLLLYVSMFPQLIAGPIVRYGTVAHEIHHRHVSAADFAEGLYRFLIGLGKKVILANQLSEISNQFLRDGLGSLSMAGAWIGIVAFTLQIYFDFSGYSDMAIGLGRCLGFHFNENFRHPYCCNSITDFWRRWHISLGSFFRDYVYIPMGGNRHHQAVNILAVWFLTGAWHGASWNFILWGGYFGVIVMVEKYTLLRNKHSSSHPFGRGWGWATHLYSMLLVVVGWGIFYFDDFSAMQTFFTALFGQSATASSFIDQCALLDNFWLWIASVLFCMPVRSALGRLFTVHCSQFIVHHSIYGLTRNTLRVVVSVVLLVLSVALLVGATNNAFIYTRF
jgi:alginate O-acetyltransferase complex protein AlgI